MEPHVQSRVGLWCFRAGCIVLWLTAALHSVAVLQEPAPQNAQEQELMRLMTEYRMELPGTTRSTRELMTGFSWQFGLGLAGLGLVAASVAWSGAAAGSVRRAAGIALLITLVVFVGIAWKYFFIFPLACQALAMVLFVVSVATSRRG